MAAVTRAAVGSCGVAKALLGAKGLKLLVFSDQCAGSRSGVCRIQCDLGPKKATEDLNKHKVSYLALLGANGIW
jgi:hypothetical protein